MDRIKVATAGLFFAWLVHDVEELLTMQATSREVVNRVPERVPLPPEWRDTGLPRGHLAVAVSTMGLIVAAAAADGYRTRGRSWSYQTALLVFGLHGAGHVGATVATRRYTSGVLTSPTVVIPFWWWAGRRLAAEGVPTNRSVAATALLPLLLLAAHGLAHAVTRQAAIMADPRGFLVRRRGVTVGP